jgi:hypothetical protein
MDDSSSFLCVCRVASRFQALREPGWSWPLRAPWMDISSFVLAGALAPSMSLRASLLQQNTVPSCSHCLQRARLPGTENPCVPARPRLSGRSQHEGHGEAGGIPEVPWRRWLCSWELGPANAEGSTWGVLLWGGWQVWGAEEARRKGQSRTLKP